MSKLLNEATHERVALNYAGAKKVPKVIANLSGTAAVGNYLWTVSDEGHKLECLVSEQQGYKLHAQIKLEKLFKGVSPDEECDLEDIAIEHGRLWLCGSHCKVRDKSIDKTTVPTAIVPRPSRNFLGSIAIEPDGSALKGAGAAIASRGAGSLHSTLRNDAYLKPFLNLPSKENGFDIEGCALLGGRLFLGLRGPVIDGSAIILEFSCGHELPMRRNPTRHFLNLGGFGIRGLARHGASLLVLAGPSGAAPGEFHIHRWRPAAPDRIRKPEAVHPFPYTLEKPEGICVLQRGSRDGLLIVYDSPDKHGRVDGTRYFADWYAFA